MKTSTRLSVIKLFLGFAGGVFLFSVLAQTAQAATYSQTDSGYKSTIGAFSSFPLFDDSQGTNAVVNYYPLGTGLTGIPFDLTLYLDPDFAGSFKAYIQEQTGVASSTRNGNYVMFDYPFGGAASAGATTTRPDEYGGAFTDTTALDPTKYYGIVFRQNVSSGTFIHGEDTGSFGWECVPHAFSCDSTFKAPYYVFHTAVAGSGSGSYVSAINSPANGENTPTVNVTFDFDYYFDSTVDFGRLTQVCARIWNETIQQSLIPVCEDITSSGAANFSQVVTLTPNMFYLWRPSIQNEDGSEVVFGDFQSFTVVTNPGGFSVLPTDDSAASTTIQGLPGIVQGLVQGFLRKWPFSWIDETTTLLIELTATTTVYEFDAVVYDPTSMDLMVWESFPDATSTAAGLGVETSWTLFSTTTLQQVADLPVWTAVRTLGSWILWLGLIFSIISGIFSYFRKQT